MDLQKAYQNIKTNFKEVEELTSKIYDETFSDYFKEVRDLSVRFSSNLSPITDQELEVILTQVPLSLFDVSERLSKFKTSYETIKLEMKEIDPKTEIESEKATLQEYRLMASIYNNICSRVDHEISFSKELIMSAKKIWDARKISMLPVSEVNDGDLPSYTESMKTKKAVW